eukprot:12411305-Alexandrium_andersonii.AAC.1
MVALFREVRSHAVPCAGASPAPPPHSPPLLGLATPTPCGAGHRKHLHLHASVVPGHGWSVVG